VSVQGSVLRWRTLRSRAERQARLHRRQLQDGGNRMQQLDRVLLGEQLPRDRHGHLRLPDDPAAERRRDTRRWLRNARRRRLPRKWDRVHQGDRLLLAALPRHRWGSQLRDVPGAQRVPAPGLGVHLELRLLRRFRLLHPARRDERNVPEQQLHGSRTGLHRERPVLHRAVVPRLDQLLLRGDGRLHVPGTPELRAPTARP